jgi:hypothetical protein
MARKLCSICGTRVVGTGKGWDTAQARTLGYCTPCMTEAEWENVHSDSGHADENCVANGWDTQDSVDACWVCHPELNEAAKDHTPRTGHTNTRAKSRTSHADHHHPRTPEARATCRKSMAATDEPYDVRKA